MKALLRHRIARRFLVGQVLSLFGDSSLLLATGLWVKDRTGSTSAAASVMFAYMAPALLGPAFGVWIDRVQRRRLMIGTNLVCAASLPLLMLASADRLLPVYLVMAILGASFTLITALQSVMLAKILPDSLLAEGNAVLQSGQEVIRLVAPLVGAGLFAISDSLTPVVILDITTFLIAVVTLVGLEVREGSPEGAERGIASEFLAGFRHIADDPQLRRLVSASVGAVTVFGLLTAVNYEVVDALGRPVEFLGVLITLQGVGALVGAPLSARFVRTYGELGATRRGLALMGAGIALLGPTSLLTVGLGMVLIGAGIPVLVVSFFTLIQRSTPDKLMGRTFAAADAAVAVPQAISVGLGAILVGVVDDYRYTIASAAAACLVAAWYVSAGSEPARTT